MHSMFMDRDTWWEVQKFRILFFVAVLFLVACVKSCGELRYTISGKVTQATVLDVKEQVVDPDHGPKAVVRYTFTDAEEKAHEGKMVLGLAEAAVLLPGPFEIIYLPSSPETHKLTSERSATWPIILGLMLLVLAALIYKLHREAHGLDRRR